jgi:hypothetical protein
VDYFRADAGFTGGLSYGTTALIGTSSIPTPSLQSVYQHMRYGTGFSYKVTGLKAGTAYTVRLQFAEIFFKAAGKRVFDVAINGATALDNLDVYIAAGSENEAIERKFIATADASGAIKIDFTTVVDSAMVSSVEVYP